MASLKRLHFNIWLLCYEQVAMHVLVSPKREYESPPMNDPFRIILFKLNLLEHNHVFTRYQMVYIETIFASLNL